MKTRQNQKQDKTNNHPMKLLAGLAMAACLGACGADESLDNASELKNVFGTDNRTAMTQTTQPYLSIGKLSTGCTATLVGRDLILTAAHCVMGNPANIRFMPNYMNGTSRLSVPLTQVWRGTTNPQGNPGQDWAVARLSMAAGETYGYMLPLDADLERHYRITLAGYSGNFMGGQTAGVHANCEIRGRDPIDKLWLHDCDSGRGSSGGPMFKNLGGQNYIVVLNITERRDGNVSEHVSRYKRSKANGAIYTASMEQRIKAEQTPMSERGQLVKPRHSRKCLDIGRSSLADYKEVIQFDCNRTLNQKFVLRPAGSGMHYIYIKHSGKVLDVEGGDISNGSEIVQNSYTGMTSQLWRLQDVRGGKKIVNVRSGKCIDVPRSSTANEVKLTQYTCHGTDNQLFDFVD